MEANRPLSFGVELNGTDRVIAGRGLLGRLIGYESRMSVGQEYFKIRRGAGHGATAGLCRNLQAERDICILANGGRRPRHVIFAVVIVAFAIEQGIAVFGGAGSRVVSGSRGIRSGAYVWIDRKYRTAAVAVGGSCDRTPWIRTAGSNAWAVGA